MRVLLGASVLMYVMVSKPVIVATVKQAQLVTNLIFLDF